MPEEKDVISEIRDHAKKAFAANMTEDDKWVSVIAYARSRLSHPSKFPTGIVVETVGRKVELKR